MFDNVQQKIIVSHRVSSKRQAVRLCQTVDVLPAVFAVMQVCIISSFSFNRIDFVMF